MFRLLGIGLSAVLFLVMPIGGSSVSAAPIRSTGAPARSKRLVLSGTISGNRTARVYANGFATILSSDGRRLTTRRVPFSLRPLLLGRMTDGERSMLLASLSGPTPQRFEPAAVNVVFRAGLLMRADSLSIGQGQLLAFRSAKSGSPISPPDYSNDSPTNAVLARLGVDHIERIAREIPKAELRTLIVRVSSGSMHPLLDLSQAYTLHLTDSSVEAAVHALAGLRTVAFVEPNWSVAPLESGSVPLPSASILRPRNAGAFLAQSLPTNYGIAVSAQSFLNTPGVDAVAAYDIVENRFGAVPGKGETITDVSIGDVCPDPATNFFGETAAPTSHQIGGQDYLDVPSMPLIPEYAVDDSGNISGAANVCGTEDPVLGEVLLDFSVMAPLPHSMQRLGALGSGYTDLLGIAPGANYRLVVPENTDPTTGSLVASLLGAADQNPRPDVITASLGFGYDIYGFPSRYLEEDPLIQSVVELIVNADGVVVSLAAGDGLRTETNAPVAPSGGSAQLAVAADASKATNLGDVSFSTAPSAVVDSGAITVGGTTTDDIFSAPPQDPRSGPLADQLAFPETRWNGFQDFSSTFGSRVNLAAPADNILAMELNGTGYNRVVSVLSGGTSAAAPMVAAAAAVALQVAKLTRRPFTTPLDVRRFLEKTGTAVPNVPQADTTVSVGPQVDVAVAVQRLLSAAGRPAQPHLARVAIAQRQSTDFGWNFCDDSGSNYTANDDSEFIEATDPTYIVLEDTGLCGEMTGSNLNAYITLAPDWEGIPADARYRLYLTGEPRRILSRTRWTRLLPAQIFAMAGLPIASATPRTVSMTYEAASGLQRLASVTFTLTFGPTKGTSQRVLAPVVPAVVTGTTIPVKYDFSEYPRNLLRDPVIAVSYPGRTNFYSGLFYYPLWVSPVLTYTKGTVDVPVSALQGGGVYGVAVRLNDTDYLGLTDGRYSVFAVTRVQRGSSERPPAPLLSTAGSGSSPVATPAPAHGIAIPPAGSFTVHYDVSSVPHATNAILEISSGGPTLYGSDNPFNNPNGSMIDDNGRDTGSVYHAVLPGKSGSVTLTAKRAHLVPGMNHVVRVLPANGATVVGEASEVSSVEEAGITAADGQALSYGYAVDPNSDVGFYTSYGEGYDPETGSEVGSSSAGLFSQSTGASENIAAKLTNPPPYTVIGGGYIGNDTVIFNVAASTSSPQCFNGWITPNYTLPPWPTESNCWVLPLDRSTQIVEMGHSLNQTSAFLAEDVGTVVGADDETFDAFTANIWNESAEAPISLERNQTGLPTWVAFDYDASTNIGYAVFNTVLATINFTTNAVTYTPLPLPGASIYDLVVDPKTHVGALSAYSETSDLSEIVLLDLANATVTSTVTIPTLEIGPTLLAVDTVHKLFVAQVPYPSADATDNNPLSCVAIVSENGTLVSQSSDLYNLTSVVLRNHWFGVNGKTRRGFLFAPPAGSDFYQLVPFRY